MRPSSAHRDTSNVKKSKYLSERQKSTMDRCSRPPLLQGVLSETPKNVVQLHVIENSIVTANEFHNGVFGQLCEHLV